MYKTCNRVSLENAPSNVVPEESSQTSLEAMPKTTQGCSNESTHQTLNIISLMSPPTSDVQQEVHDTTCQSQDHLDEFTNDPNRDPSQSPSNIKTIGFYDLIKPHDYLDDAMAHPAFTELHEYSELNHVSEERQNDLSLERFPKGNQLKLIKARNYSTLEELDKTFCTSLKSCHCPYSNPNTSTLDTTQFSKGCSQNTHVKHVDPYNEYEFDDNGSHIEQHLGHVQDMELSHLHNFTDFELGSIIPNFNETIPTENSNSDTFTGNDCPNALTKDVTKIPKDIYTTTETEHFESPSPNISPKLNHSHELTNMETNTANYDTCTLIYSSQYNSSKESET